MIYSEPFDYGRDYSLKHTFEYYARINGTLRNEYKYIEVCREIDDSGIVHESQVDTIEEYTGIPIKKYLLERSEVYFGQPVHSWAEARRFFDRKGRRCRVIPGDVFLQALRNMT